VRELQTGLWHWEAPHPDWRPGDSSLEWERQEVSSYAIDDGNRLVLFDPLALPSEIEELAFFPVTIDDSSDPRYQEEIR
jgi:hypothetical protein